MARGQIRPKRGGDKKLDAWREAMRTAPKALGSVSRNGAEEIVGLIKDEFRTESDPYGKPWKPKKVPDGRKVLSGKTSNLKGGWHVTKANDHGFTVAPFVDYAAPHQTGTRRGLPKRPMVPDRGLPKKWSAALKETAIEVYAAHFAKAGSGGSGGLGSITSKLTSLGRFNIRSLFTSALRRVSGDGT